MACVNCSLSIGVNRCIIFGPFCWRFVRFCKNTHHQGNSKVFYTFSAEYCGESYIFSAEYLWILYTFCAEYWGGDYIFSAECAGGCGGVSFDEWVGEMGGVSGGNGFFRCFVVVKIGCE